jgi:hypothetical protein
MGSHNLSIDVIFSYWILGWVGLRLAGVVSWSPKLWIFLGLLENIGVLTLMFMWHTRRWLVALYCCMIVLSKLVPLCLLWDDSVEQSDVVASVAVFLVYLVWVLGVRGLSWADFVEYMGDLVVRNRNILPAMIAMDAAMKN